MSSPETYDSLRAKPKTVWDWWHYCHRCKNESWPNPPSPVGEHETKCERCDYDEGREQGRQIESNRRDTIFVRPLSAVYFVWYPYLYANAYYKYENNRDDHQILQHEQNRVSLKALLQHDDPGGLLARMHGMARRNKITFRLCEERAKSLYIAMWPDGSVELRGETPQRDMALWHQSLDMLDIGAVKLSQRELCSLLVQISARTPPKHRELGHRYELMIVPTIRPQQFVFPGGRTYYSGSYEEIEIQKNLLATCLPDLNGHRYGLQNKQTMFVGYTVLTHYRINGMHAQKKRSYVGLPHAGQ
jgi:hypothetical protein